jgi:hypothetical protein
VIAGAYFGVGGGPDFWISVLFGPPDRHAAFLREITAEVDGIIASLEPTRSIPPAFCENSTDNRSAWLSPS